VEVVEGLKREGADVTKLSGRLGSNTDCVTIVEVDGRVMLGPRVGGRVLEEEEEVWE